MATPIKILRPAEQYDMIIARFCRTWPNKNFKTERIFSQDYVLVDEEHETIHATVRDCDIPFVKPKIEVGKVYEIRQFYVSHNKQNYKIVPHAAMLQLSKATTFTIVIENNTSIPLNKFHFSEYDQLSLKINNTTILTDVIGVLTTAQPLERPYAGDKIIARKTVTIQNIRSEALHVTLWGTIAENLDEEIKAIHTETTVAIFSAMNVKEYMGETYVSSTTSSLFYLDLNIAETQTLKTRFVNQMKKIELIPSAIKQVESLDIQKTKNRKTINELKNVDPNDRYTIRATITNFNISEGWFYNSCPTCNKSVRPSGRTWFCNDHGFLNTLPMTWYRLNTEIQDATDKRMVTIIGKAAQILIKKPCSTLTIDEGFNDPSVLPPAIEQLRGQSKIFQIYFKVLNTTTSVVVSKIFDDEPAEITSISSSTSSTSPTPSTLSSLASIVNPETPIPKQIITSAEKTTKSKPTKRKLLSSEEEEKKKKKMDLQNFVEHKNN